MSGPAFWRRKSFRRWAIQGGFVVTLALLVIGTALTARVNLAAQGLTSGFGFLWKSTGWKINFTLLPTTTSDPYWWYLVLGLMNTLFMGVIGLAGASALGLAVGLMRSGRNPAARLLGTVYIEIFRNLPLILQPFFWYALANALPAPRQSIALVGWLVNSRGIYLPGLNIGPGPDRGRRRPWPVALAGLCPCPHAAGVPGDAADPHQPVCLAHQGHHAGHRRRIFRFLHGHRQFDHPFRPDP